MNIFFIVSLVLLVDGLDDGEKLTRGCVFGNGAYRIKVSNGTRRIRLDSAPVDDISALWGQVTIEILEPEAGAGLSVETWWQGVGAPARLLEAVLRRRAVTADQLWMRRYLVIDNHSGDEVLVRCERAVNVWALVLLAVGAAMVGLGGELLEYAPTAAVLGAVPGSVLGPVLPLLYMFPTYPRHAMMALIPPVFVWLVMILHLHDSKVVVVYLGISGLLGGFWFGSAEHQTPVNWSVALVGCVLLAYCTPFVWISVMFIVAGLCIRQVLHLKIPHTLFWRAFYAYRSYFPRQKSFITPAEYVLQGRDCTTRALDDLRHYLFRNPAVWRTPNRVSDDARTNLEHFVATGEH